MIIIPDTTEQKKGMADWLSARVKGASFENPDLYTAVTFAIPQKIQSVILLHDYKKPNIALSLASDDPRWATRKNILFIGNYVYKQLKCKRTTALVRKGNKRSRRFLEGIGFKLEGMMRCAEEDSTDVCLYGCLPREFYGFINRSRDGIKKTADGAHTS